MKRRHHQGSEEARPLGAAHTTQRTSTRRSQAINTRGTLYAGAVRGYSVRLCSANHRCRGRLGGGDTCVFQSGELQVLKGQVLVAGAASAQVT